MDPTALLWSHLGILTQQRYQALKDVYGTLAEARAFIGDELLAGLGCRAETVRSTLMRLEDFDQDALEAELRKRGITFVSIEDEVYPAKLKHAADAPPFLYVRGDLRLLEQPCIACVGTRQMSQYGRRVTEEIVSGFVAGGLVTVSGLALGIDAAVAEVTLRMGGKTIAVLGHGLSLIYPKSHEKLAEKIVETGGLLMSEFPLDWQPGNYTFPARNRIIAGVSLATVVLEAPAESGALITADFALEEGREVFAVPGQIFDPNFAGCHALIAKNKAKLITGATDVLRELGIVEPAAGGSAYEPRSEDEALLVTVLTTMPQAMDALVEKAGLDIGRASAALTMMELMGGAKNVGGGQWVKA